MNDVEVKEFLVHLRKIHFSLVLSCCAFLIGVLYGVDFEYSLAKDEIGVIEKTNEYLNSSWVNTVIQEDVIDEVLEFYLNFYRNYNTLNFGMVDSVKKLYKKFPYLNFWAINSINANKILYNEKIVLTIGLNEQDSLILEASIDSSELRKLFINQSPSFESNPYEPILDIIKNSWDRMYEKSKLFIAGKPDLNKAFAIINSDTFKVNQGRMKDDSFPNVSKINLVSNEKFRKGYYRFEDELSAAFTLFWYGDLANISNVKIIIPFVPLEFGITPIKFLNKGKNQNFRTRFPNLMRLVDREKITLNLSLKEIKSYINDEIGKRSNYVEIFSIRIQSDILVYSGILIILLTQFYFNLHLKNFLRKTKKSFNIIPWIALYEDFFSKAVFFLSSIILPASTIYYLILIIKEFASFNSIFWYFVIVSNWSITLLILFKVIKLWKMLHTRN